MKPNLEIERFHKFLISGKPFIFIRFSDGEIEILRNQKLELNAQGVIWNRGNNNFKYPSYDYKRFDPELDSDFRDLLVGSATYRRDYYFKGIPTGHNRDYSAKKLMITLNGESTENLTFADLFINSNYKYFLTNIVPWLQNHRVTVVGNYRLEPKKASDLWNHIRVPDGAFQLFSSISDSVIHEIEQLPQGSIVVCSASSLTNIIGYRLAQLNLPITFIDIGTALHPILGLEDSRRSYLSQVKPWVLGNLKEKISYHLSRGSRIRW